MKKIYSILSYEIEPPKTFGILHIISAVIIAFLTTLLSKFSKKHTEKTERKIAACTWFVLLFFEIYKQIVSSIELIDGVFVFSYDYSSFPFQLCSAPLYTLPVIAFFPSGKIREAFVRFFGTFVLLGGLAVCVYPGNVFVETLGINIHTMFWHGSQVILGVYFNSRRFAKTEKPNLKKYFLSAFVVFLAFVAIAIALNHFVYAFLTSNAIDETFNMFYISPYFECIFPVFDLIQKIAPYPVFVFSYILVLSVFSYILIFTHNLLIRRSKKDTLSARNY